ncbi:MAG: hypothetical protein ACKV0T_00925 [Planctomycetales bacterium]
MITSIPCSPDELLQRVVPQFFPAHWLADCPILHSAFPSRIRIGYVLRGEGQYAYVNAEDFAPLGIPVQELHTAALVNLAKLECPNLMVAKPPTGAVAWFADAEDNFGAVRILLPMAQEQLIEDLGESFLVALSHRDDCFCWNLQQTPEEQKKHCREALERFCSEEYSLTPDILLFSQGTFLLSIEQPV